MAQMQTISIRIPDDDFQWLLSVAEAKAKTPSEKLRYLLSRAREQEAGRVDYRRCATWMRELAQPFADGVGDVERQHKIHSDLVAAVCEHVPQIMSTLVSEHPAAESDESKMREVEAQLAQQCFRLLTAILRIGVTSSPATYDKQVLNPYLDDIIEIATIISTRKNKEVSNG
ncbi:MAG: hypothetical protein WAO71_06415 [Gallionella sp.]